MESTLLSEDKCPDFVVNRGHYFGTDKLGEEPGLSDSDKEALIASLERRLLQDKLKPKQEATLRDYLTSKEQLDDTVILKAIRLVMSTPEFQVA